MGISCQIYIKKPQEGVHKAGQPIYGILKYAVDTPMEFQTAVLSLVGSAKCEWREHHGDTSTTYTGHEDLLTRSLNILNIRPNLTVNLPIGAYEFPFEFLPPYEIPPSFQDYHGHIRYHVKARFEKPDFFSLAKKFEKEIIIYGNVNPVTPLEPITYRLQKNLFKPFSSREHNVNLEATIQKTFVTPGENICLDFSVLNDTDDEIQVTVQLVCKTTYTSTGLFGKEKHKEKTLCKSVSPVLRAQHTSKFSKVIPTFPELYSIQHCKIICKEFFARVTVNLSFPHIDPVLEIPVVIGEGRNGDLSGVIELEDDFDAPPSYTECIKSDKI